MNENTIMASCSCGNDGGCTDKGCTGDVTTCSANPCCKKDADSSDKKKSCDTCGSELKSGMKYTDICLECEPAYKARCGGCQRLLWDCMCIKPHAWD